MTRRPPSPTVAQAPARLIRMLVALAVMLLAVLPHATMAAGVAMGGPSGSRMTHGMAVAPSSAAQPCHERTEQTAEPDRPACCVMGCGLIAQLCAEPAPSMIRGWDVVGRSHGTAGIGTAPAPAEKPPRRGA